MGKNDSNIDWKKELIAYLPSIIKYGEEFFGKEKWDEIASGKFDFKAYRKAAADMERAKLHYEMLKTSSLEQFKNLASVSALASTLLVIATFNDRIFPYSIWVKILLTILLIAIIISLWAYYKNFSNASEKSYNELLKLHEQNGDMETVLAFKKIKDSAKRNILGYTPIVVNFLVTFAIIGILILIWK